MKTCTKCKEPRELTLFTKDKRASDGLQSQCEICRRVAKKAAYNVNPQKYIAKVASWRRANPEKVQAQSMRQSDANVRRARAWALANPEKRLEIARQYKYRRRLQEGRSDEYPTLSQVIDRDGDACYLCGLRVDFEVSAPDPSSASLDHMMPLSRGGDHTLDNSGLTHLGCNIHKGARTPEEWWRLMSCAC